MVRKLKYHEQKLLRKVDFITYKSDNNHRDAAVCRRYAVQNPNDYTKYSRIVGQVQQLAHRLSLLPPTSPFRAKQTQLLLSKLHSMGLLTHDPISIPQLPDPDSNSGLLTSTATLSLIPGKITVSAFCRRRLPVVITRLHMAETVQAANKLIEQGHVRVGTEVVTDTAFLVTRGMEDWVTWAVGSKIRGTVERWRGVGDDYDLL